MTKTAKAIAKAHNLSGVVVFGRKLSGPGPSIRGWFTLEPAGSWRYLGSRSSDLLP